MCQGSLDLIQIFLQINMQNKYFLLQPNSHWYRFFWVWNFENDLLWYFGWIFRQRLIQEAAYLLIFILDGFAFAWTWFRNWHPYFPNSYISDFFIFPLFCGNLDAMVQWNFWTDREKWNTCHVIWWMARNALQFFCCLFYIYK